MAMRERYEGWVKRAQEREVRKAIKGQLKEQRLAYYAKLEAERKTNYEEMFAKNLEWKRRKEAVFADARKEFIKALVEDEQYWKTHPNEMMNKKYKTYRGVHFHSPYN